MIIIHPRLPLAVAAPVLIGLLFGGCSGSGSSNTPLAGGSGTPPAPVLVPGATYQFAGTENVNVTYTMPSATNVNSVGTYTYTVAQAVSNAPSGSPAAFDVNRTFAYSATQTPASGQLLLAQVVDNYENQSTSGATETITLAASKVIATGVDLNAGLRLGGGPFNQSSTSTTTYVAPQNEGVYPLQSGTVTVQPLARTVTATTMDANAGGTAGGGGPTTTTFNNDGSFTRSSTFATNGSTQQQTVNSNGTATTTTTTTGGTVTQSAVGAPAGATIPVVVTTSGTPQTYTAANWYPNGAVPAPLATTTRTVKGPATLPAACAFSGTPPVVIEVDTATSNLDPLGSLGVTLTQNYTSNGGIEICRTDTSTTTNVNLQTGATTSTVVTTFAERLVSSNQAIMGVRQTP